jgi:uncharacterized membrane protein YdjX (TVP38/TMEM64 family)
MKKLQNIGLFLKKHFRELLVFLVLIIFIFGTVYTFQSFGVDKIEQYIAGAGLWGPLFFILIHASTIVVAPFEGSFLMITSGVLFGYWPGVAYTIIAGFIGSSINFWLSRRFGSKIVQKLIGKKGVEKINQISDYVDEHPVVLIPLMASTLFDLVGYAAGLTRVKYKNFLIAVAVSSVINVPIYVAVGRGFIRGENSLLWLVVGVSVVVSVYFLYRYLAKKIFSK